MAWPNYATICRLCLKQDGFLLAIFSNQHETNDTSIQRKIYECTALQVSSNDGLPSCICHRCLYKVELCLEFKQQCLVADATLRQINGHDERTTTTAVVNSDQDDAAPYRTVSMHEFEKFSYENQNFIPDHGQNVENVVMVVNPDLDYDSENESESEEAAAHTAATASDGEREPEPSELRNVSMCKYCDRAYVEREQCRRHERTEHNAHVPFLCAHCDMSFADRTNYTAHLKSVHQNDKPFGCPQCPRSFSRRSDLRKHTVVHTGIKPFTCNQCYKSFSRNTNLTKHLRIHSGHKPYVCAQCPKTFISKGDLTRHALIHSGHKPFACNYCEQSFGRRDKLLRHEKRHFPNSNEDRSSAVSELEFLRQQIALSGFGPDVVKQEVADDDDDEEDEEEEEDEAVAVAAAAGGAESMVISVDPFPRLLPDHITGDEATAYGHHLKAVSAMKKYPCVVCYKRFSSAESLRFHQATHSGNKPHACTQCPKAFLRKRELDRHQATHTGMKPFRCTHCDKRFGRKDKLVRHTRIHTGGGGGATKATSTSASAPPHKPCDCVCTVCGATFPRNEALANHMKTIHSELKNLH